MRTGCFVCNRKLDKFYLLATPDGKKYKVCARCMNLAKAFAATAGILNLEDFQNIVKALEKI